MRVYASSLFNETSLHVRRYLKLLSRDSTTFTLIEVSKGLIVSETDIALRVELTGKRVGPREGRLTITATAFHDPNHIMAAIMGPCPAHAWRC